MANESALKYSPPWYHVGDADLVHFGILYGMLAMATIWALESLVHKFLFSQRKDLFLSDIAAFVSLTGCTWIDIFTWTRGKPKPVTSRGQNILDNSRVAWNRRVFFAVFLRVLVIIIDIAVVVVSIPRSVRVLEDEVGSSQFNFNKGVKLVHNKGELKMQFSNCVIDKLPYEGFSPTAVRKLCVIFPKKPDLKRFTFNRDDFLRLGREHEEFIAMEFSPIYGEFFYLSKMVTFRYKIVHLLDPNGVQEQDRDFNEDKIVLLPLPRDIVVQATKAFLGIDYYKNMCKVVPKYSVGNFKRVISCYNGTKLERKRFGKGFAQALFSVAFTQKVRPSRKKLTPEEKESGRFSTVGHIARPRLCLFPFLILLTILMTSDTIAYFFLGRENLVVKLFYAMQELSNPDTPHSTPLHVRDMKITIRSGFCVRDVRDRQNGPVPYQNAGMVSNVRLGTENES